jgi:vancomycin permeability regulator SanA
MQRLFRIILQLVMAALLCFLILASLIIFDGLHDHGKQADVALVTGYPANGESKALQLPWLDHAAKLFQDGAFSYVIVSAPDRWNGEDETAMARYLEAHGVPSNVILEGHRRTNTEAMARDAAGIMREHDFQSVIIITDYYHVTRTKLVLNHAGITQIGNSHVGTFQLADAWNIGREVVALYKYVAEVYVLPAANKVKEEAEVGVDKAKADAQKAKEKVDKSLDSLPK